MGRINVELPTPPILPPLERGYDACGDALVPANPYEALLTSLNQAHIPFWVIWELTHRCNLHCVMCYNVPRDQAEMSTAECLSTLDQLAQAGTLRLTLTGGEVLTRRDFFEIASHARRLGFALNLKTNGTLLTPALADQVAALDPVQVEMSLLGATPATFDAVAGGHNTLARVVRGVRLLQERQVRVKLSSLLLSLNAAEQQQMAELALSLGVAYQQNLNISPDDDGQNPPQSYQLSPSALVEALDRDHTPFHPRHPTPQSRTCKVGLSTCLISPYGEIYPCVELRTPVGNLRQQPFADIWTGAPLFRQLRARHTMQYLHDCQACPINQYCEGRCAGLAWKEHGDFLGGHTLACQHAQARYAQQHPGEPVPETPLQTRQHRNGPAPTPGSLLPLSAVRLHDVVSSTRQ